MTALAAALWLAGSCLAAQRQPEPNPTLERITGPLAAQNWVTQQAQPTEEQIAAALEAEKLKWQPPRTAPSPAAPVQDALDAARVAEAAVAAAPRAFAPTPASAAAPAVALPASPASSTAAVPPPAIRPSASAASALPAAPPVQGGTLKGFDRPKREVTIQDLEEPIDPNGGLFDASPRGAAAQEPKRRQGFAETVRPAPVD